MCLGVFGDREGVARPLTQVAGRILKEQIAVVTAFHKSTASEFFSWDTYEQLLPYTLSNMYMYTKLHGYEFHPFNHNLFRQGRKSSWVEIEVLRCYLQRYKWVFWTDVDFMFVNLSKPFELPLNADMVVSYECSDPRKLMSGNVLMRSSDWSFRFLDSWDKLYNSYRTAINHDQIAFEHLTKHHGAHIDVRAPSTFMTYDSCKQDPPSFGVHFPGPNKVKRILDAIQLFNISTAPGKWHNLLKKETAGTATP